MLRGGKMIVQEVVMHERPHLDEIAALWLLLRFGKEKYPGVKEAEWKLGGMGGEDLLEFSPEEAEAAGTLAIGVGGGRFDEHPGPNEQKKEGCATTLVAQDLGIEKEPQLQQILRFVEQGDLKGGNHPFDLASLVKTLHQANEPLKVIKWVMDALDAKYQEQGRFLVAQKEVQESSQTEIVRGPRCELMLVYGVSSNEEFAKAARNRGAAVVIQRHPPGDYPLANSTQIFTTKRFGLKMYDVVAMLRAEEQKAVGKVATTDWDALRSEGKVPGCPEWYFHEEGQMILNGSTSAPDTPRSRLDLEQVVQIVKTGLDPKAFEPARQSTCLGGVCNSTAASPCPWYCYGLARCREIRFRQKAKAS